MPIQLMTNEELCEELMNEYTKIKNIYDEEDKIIERMTKLKEEYISRKEKEDNLPY